jgi:hypothetical protein
MAPAPSVSRPINGIRRSRVSAGTHSNGTAGVLRGRLARANQDVVGLENCGRVIAMPMVGPERLGTVDLQVFQHLERGR